jgi:PAS domain S-box-containing protein/putative nucleotidyltransferase with HDIG domain
MAKDITELRTLKNQLARMEQELFETEKRYRIMVENAADVIWTVTLQMQPTYISPNITRLLGYSVEEALSMKMEDIFTAHSFKNCMMVLKEEFQRENEAGVDKSRDRTLGIDLIHKDGRIIPVEIKYSFIRDNNGAPREILAIARDITERKRAEEAAGYEKQLLDDVLNSMPGIFYILDEDCRIIRCNRSQEWTLGYTPEEVMNRDATLLIDEKEREYVSAKIKEAFHTGHAGVTANAVTKKGIKVPLHFTGTKVARGDKTMIVGMGIDMTEQKKSEEKLKKSVQELQDSMEGAIAAIAMITEMRDPYTAGHQRRVAVLASAIAEEMQFTDEQVLEMRMAGILHDVGKASIPMEILCKPVALDPMEMDIIKLHPKVGHDILKLLKLPSSICPCVLQHHERMNGSGYPGGLAGDDIMMGARILAVADVVEAMSSNRPYRPSLGVNKALEEIENNKGVLYDHMVSDACLKLFNEKGFDFEWESR